MRRWNRRDRFRQVCRHSIRQLARWSRRLGVSVSEMVEAYLAAVARPSAAPRDTPILRSLRGSLRKASQETYRKHLVVKYR